MRIFIKAALAATLMALPVASLAQLHESHEHNEGLEEVIISASPQAKTKNEIAGSVNVIDGETLKREVGSTLGETLKNQIGVHSSSFGPGVGVPVIRGQSGKRVEILQNSTTIADVSDTSVDHSVAAEALLADRIEILRGPSILRYGSGAIGGVVNVIDYRIHTDDIHEGVEGAIEARYDSNNEEHALIGRIDMGTGNFNLHLDGMTRDSEEVEIPGYAQHEFDDPDEATNGFIENSDREADAFSLGLSWIGDSVAGGFSISRIESNYGVPPGAHGHHEEHGEEGHDDEEEGHEEDEEGHSEEEEVLVRIDLEQTQYQGKLVFSDLGANFERLDIDLNYSEYEHRELEIEEGIAEEGTLFASESTELRAELVHSSIGGWLGAFGLQYSNRDFEAAGAEAFVPPSETEKLGIYIIEETQLGQGTLELGARYDDQTLDSASGEISHDSFNLSASYLINLNDSQRLGFIVSRSERAPVAEELLSEGEHIATNTYEIGDATLDNESAFNAEITWAMNTDFISAKASAFHSDFSDYIYEMDTELRFSHDLEEEDGLTGLNACSDDIADFENNEEEFEESVECFLYVQEDATFTGIEAELDFAVTEQHSLRFWGDYVRADFDNSGDVPRMPPARIGASWDFDLDNWSAQVSLTKAFDQDRPGEGQEETSGYTRLDAFVEYGFDDFSIFAKATNLTNDEIRNSTSFLRELAPEPGRGFLLGARYRF